jgi:hypothetical protein
LSGVDIDGQQLPSSRSRTAAATAPTTGTRRHHRRAQSARCASSSMRSA